MTKRFYDALEEALTVTQITVAELCRQAGVSKDQINKFLQRGRRGDGAASTNVDDAVKIAHALGLTLDEMLGDQTASLRSDAAALWRQLSEAERAILLDAARGRRADLDSFPE